MNKKSSTADSVSEHSFASWPLASYRFGLRSQEELVPALGHVGSEILGQPPTNVGMGLLGWTTRIGRREIQKKWENRIWRRDVGQLFMTKNGVETRW